MEIIKKEKTKNKTPRHLDMLILYITICCDFTQLSSCCRGTRNTVAYKEGSFLFFEMFEGTKTTTKVEEELISL